MSPDAASDASPLAPTLTKLGMLLLDSDSSSDPRPAEPEAAGYGSLDRARSLPSNKRPHPLRLKMNVPLADTTDEAYMTITAESGSNTFPRLKPDDERQADLMTLHEARRELEVGAGRV